MEDRPGSFEKDKLEGLFFYSLRHLVDIAERGACKQEIATGLHVLCYCAVTLHVKSEDIRTSFCSFHPV
jgi:hypothetical protein